MIKGRRNMNDKEYEGTAWIYDDVEIDINDLMKGKSYEEWEEYLPVIKRLLTLPDKRDFTSLLKVDKSDDLITLYGTTLDGIQIVEAFDPAEDLDLELLLLIVNAQYVAFLDRFKSGVMDSLFHRKPRMRINGDVDDEHLHIYDQGYEFGLNLDISLTEYEDDNVKRDINKELHDLDIYNIVTALHTEPTYDPCEWMDDEE